VRPVFDLSRIAASGLVAQIDYHESIGSTNDRALELAAAGEVALPLLVLAERQTAGRGRGGNHWWTETGALTFSLALEAPAVRLPPHRWPQVALTAGIAVYDALRTQSRGAELRLKWPNDVYLAGRKVCGVLSESVPGWRDRLVVGIGVNVNNRVQGGGNRGPETGGGGREQVAFNGTSLIEQDGVERELTTVLLAVLDEFDRCWRRLVDDDFSGLADEYRQRCFLTGKTVTIMQPGGQSVIGVCLGIADDGVLRLRCGDGERAVLSGTVAGFDG
jgi:BirA family biotin operon repressor/biotin-[acetyl-CoA-carboxylase] ligase